jgi:hypothetical protein
MPVIHTVELQRRLDDAVHASYPPEQQILIGMIMREAKKDRQYSTFESLPEDIRSLVLYLEGKAAS